MRSILAAPVGRLGCRSRRLGTLAPSVRARYEEEALSRLRATSAIDPALVTVKSVVVRQSGRALCSLEFASAACPQRAEIEAVAQKTLLDAEWVNGCDVEARVRRPPSFMGAKAPASLQHVGALIGVSSCKGGVGKSTVAVNLAFALAGLGARVGLLDADVHGPSLPSLVALPEGSLPIVQRLDNKLLTPPLVGGVRLMSYGFIAKGASTGRVPAAVMRGPMVGKVVGQMLSGTEWGDLDYLLVDLPPGTGDVQLTLCQTYGLSAALVITTPQRLARVDVEKGIDMFRELAVPIIGLVENMGYFTDGHGEVHHPFGTSQLEAVREYAGVAAHAAFRLPIEAAVSAACDASTPIVVAYPKSATAGALSAAAAQLTLDVARLQHAQRGAQAAQLRFDPKRGLVLRVLAGVDEGRCSAVTPLRAIAVAPPSPQQILKSRAVYGSRVYRLQEATPAAIIDDKNVFTLFITGVYGSTADKATKKELEKLEKKALLAAGKGNAADANAAIKEFVALGKIEELDMKPGSYYNAKSPCDRAGLQCGYQYEGYLGSRNDADLEKAARVAEALKAQAKSSR